MTDYARLPFLIEIFESSDRPTTMTLLLIRHGETELNAARIVQFPDTPLGASGRQQADRLGRSLARRDIGRVLTSDYIRARMTADSVVAHTGAPLVTSANLRERNFGAIRGLAYDELGALDVFAQDYVPPDGESWPEFHARVDRAWQEIVAHVDGLTGDLVVVTHGLVLRSLLERVLDLSGHVIEPGVVVANTSVTVVERAPPWRVLDFAGVGHLDHGVRDVAPV